jgi:hypothetical protein
MVEMRIATEDATNVLRDAPHDAMDIVLRSTGVIIIHNMTRPRLIAAM